MIGSAYLSGQGDQNKFFCVHFFGKQWGGVSGGGLYSGDSLGIGFVRRTRVIYDGNQVSARAGPFSMVWLYSTCPCSDNLK